MLCKEQLHRYVYVQEAHFSTVEIFLFPLTKFICMVLVLSEWLIPFTSTSFCFFLIIIFRYIKPSFILQSFL